MNRPSAGQRPNETKQAAPTCDARAAEILELARSVGLQGFADREPIASPGRGSAQRPPSAKPQPTPSNDDGASEIIELARSVRLAGFERK